jgi:large-conductance mechanosensitive channel
VHLALIVYGMNVRKMALYLFIAFAVFFVIQSPGEAAAIVRATGENAGEWFTTAAEAFTRFLNSLF